jgi:hypothetical protein
MDNNDAVPFVAMSLAVGVAVTVVFTLLSYPPTERLGISSYDVDSLLWFWFAPLLFGTVAGGLFLRYRLVTPLLLLAGGLFAYGLWPTEFSPVLVHFYIFSAGGVNLLLAVASGEYIIRRVAGYLSQPLLPATERALLIGLIAGSLYFLFYGFYVFDLTENLSPVAGATEPVLYHIISATYVYGGAILLGAVPIALLIRFGLVTPLVLPALDLLLFLSNPQAGDFGGPLGVFFWPFYLVLGIVFGGIEYGLRGTIDWSWFSRLH